MTRTNVTPKVLAITPAPQQRDRSASPKAQTLGDAYATAGPNPYQGLMAGQKAQRFEPKAEALDGGVLSEMRDAEQDVRSQRNRQDYHGRIQDILYGRFICGGDVREKAPSDVLGNIPHVPDFNKEILNAGTIEQIKPVVQRYAALEKVILSLFGTVDNALKNGRMTVGEIKAFRAQRAKLEETLYYCRDQLTIARDYWKMQIESDASSS